MYRYGIGEYLTVSLDLSVVSSVPEKAIATSQSSWREAIVSEIVRTIAGGKGRIGSGGFAAQIFSAMA